MRGSDFFHRVPAISARQTLLQRVLALTSWELLFIVSPDNVIEAGTGVSQLTDLSGNNAHALQGTDANRPSLATGSNGASVLTFNGTSDYFEGTLANTLDSDDGVEVFCATSGGADIQDAYFDAEPTNSLTNQGLLFYRGIAGVATLRCQGDQNAEGTTSLDDWVVVHGRNEITDRRVYVNGVEEGQNTVSRGGTLQYFRIGSLFQNVYFLNADVAFFGFVSGGILSDSVRAEIAALLVAEYVP